MTGYLSVSVIRDYFSPGRRPFFRFVFSGHKSRFQNVTFQINKKKSLLCIIGELATG